MKAIQLLVFTVAIGLATTLHADLVGVDLHTPGDQLLTLDSSTGLEWLDLKPTLNLSLSQMKSLSSTSGEFSEFRLATVTEFDALLDHASVPHTLSAADDSAGITNVTRFQGFFGAIAKPIIPGPIFPPVGKGYYTVGFVQDSTPDSFALARVFIYDYDSGPEMYDVFDYTFGPSPIVDPLIGYFLVRSVPVPEPAAFSLYTGAALLLLCLVRRRRVQTEN
jgi:hypothetical protein